VVRRPEKVTGKPKLARGNDLGTGRKTGTTSEWRKDTHVQRKSSKEPTIFLPTGKQRLISVTEDTLERLKGFWKKSG